MELTEVFRRTVLEICKEPALYPNTSVMFAYRGGNQVVVVYSSELSNLSEVATLGWISARLVSVVGDQIEIDTSGSEHSLIYDSDSKHWEFD